MEVVATAPEGGPAPLRERRVSLALRLTLLAAVWSVAALIVTAAALTAFFHMAAIDRFQTGLEESAEALYAGATVDQKTGAVNPPAVTDVRAGRVYSGRYWQIAEPTPEGLHPLIRSKSLWDSELKAPPDRFEGLVTDIGRPVYYNSVGPNGERLRVAAILALLPNRTEPLIFMAAQDRAPIDRDDRRFAFLTALTLVMLGVGLVIAVVVQVRIGLSPLRDLRREVADVRKGKAQRLAGRYPTEVAPLAVEMNAVLDVAREVVERQRAHVGNLAHALKTPLSVMLSETTPEPGGVQSPLAAVVAKQVEVMQAQVDHHLRRARAAARAPSSGERTKVEPVLDELASTLERVFQDKGVEIDWRAPENLAFRGERQDLLEIVGNLLENACKWCRRRVRVTAEPIEGERLRLTVEDDGPGLPEEDRDAVLERGLRLDESAPGSGLGLSIVDELARAYGGRIRLDAAAAGGLKAMVELPAVHP